MYGKITLSSPGDGKRTIDLDFVANTVTGFKVPRASKPYAPKDGAVGSLVTFEALDGAEMTGQVWSAAPGAHCVWVVTDDQRAHRVMLGSVPREQIVIEPGRRYVTIGEARRAETAPCVLRSAHGAVWSGPNPGAVRQALSDDLTRRAGYRINVFTEDEWRTLIITGATADGSNTLEWQRPDYAPMTGPSILRRYSVSTGELLDTRAVADSRELWDVADYWAGMRAAEMHAAITVTGRFIAASYWITCSPAETSPAPMAEAEAEAEAEPSTPEISPVNPEGSSIMTIPETSAAPVVKAKRGQVCAIVRETSVTSADYSRTVATDVRFAIVTSITRAGEVKAVRYTYDAPDTAPTPVARIHGLTRVVLCPAEVTPELAARVAADHVWPSGHAGMPFASVKEARDALRDALRPAAPEPEPVPAPVIPAAEISADHTEGGSQTSAAPGARIKITPRFGNKLTYWDFSDRSAALAAIAARVSEGAAREMDFHGSAFSDTARYDLEVTEPAAPEPEAEISPAPEPEPVPAPVPSVPRPAPRPVRLPAPASATEGQVCAILRAVPSRADGRPVVITRISLAIVHEVTRSGDVKAFRWAAYGLASAPVSRDRVGHIVKVIMLPRLFTPGMAVEMAQGDPIGSLPELRALVKARITPDLAKSKPAPAPAAPPAAPVAEGEGAPAEEKSTPEISPVSAEGGSKARRDVTADAARMLAEAGETRAEQSERGAVDAAGFVVTRMNDRARVEWFPVGTIGESAAEGDRCVMLDLYREVFEAAGWSVEHFGEWRPSLLVSPPSAS